MPQVPAIDEVSLPGRILFRSGLSTQIPAAGLRLGEGALTTDNWWGWLGDESQNPPAWPTNKTVGDFDWTNLNPYFKNINVETINGKTLSVLFNEYITTGKTPVITIINENLTKTVYGTNPDFVDLEAAYAWLSQRTISTLGSVTLVFPVGKITETKTYNFNHPNGDRIYWKGADLKQPIPSYTNFQISGNTAAAQANDNVANLALLRLSYSTEIYFTQGGSLGFTGDLALMKNLLITSDGALGGKGLVVGLTVDNCRVNFENITVAGFDNIGCQSGNSASVFIANNSNFICLGNGGGGIAVVTNGLFACTTGNVICISNGARHAADFDPTGLQINDNSLFASYPYYTQTFKPVVYVAGNSKTGVNVSTSVFAGVMNLIISQNGSTGINTVNGGSTRVAGVNVVNNGNNGIIADTFSLCNTPNANVTGNTGVGFGAYNGSFIFRNGSNVANNGLDYSPALGTTGNTNALIA